MTTTVIGPLWRRMMAMICMVAVVAVTLMTQGPASAADRGKLEAFLNVTGFDVSLDSIALSAGTAPEMLGLEAEDFGFQWSRMAAEVFDTANMREMALDILEPGLSDDMLGHAAMFYASDLGQRLVAAENASHMEPDDDATRAEGEAILAELMKHDSPRLEYLSRMNKAIDASGSTVRAVQEIQTRFILAASAAGVIDMNIDEDGLRALMRDSEGEMRQSIEASALVNAARTYRAFSDEDVLAYAKALEDERMQEVYTLMNAIQWEIMANRFEALAIKMAGMTPGQEL